LLAPILENGTACIGVEVFVDPGTAASPTEVARQLKAALDATVATAL